MLLLAKETTHSAVDALGDRFTKPRRKLAMNSEKNSHSQAELPLLDHADHAEQLIWSLLDDHIEEEDVRRLEELMKENEQVRLRYLQSCRSLLALPIGI